MKTDIKGLKIGVGEVIVKTENGKFKKTIKVTVIKKEEPVINNQTEGKIVKIGDVNNDGVVNIVDLIKLRQYLAGLINLDSEDLIKLRKYLAGLEDLK